MKHFLLFIQALILCAAMAISSFLPGVTADKQGKIERIADNTPPASRYSVSGSRNGIVTVKDATTEPIAVVIEEHSRIKIVTNMIPKESNNSNIEVDGISFETLMPERELVVPEKPSDGRKLLDLGIRITNNTTTPLRFCFHDAITPELMLPSGQIIRETGQWSDWLIGYEESDFPLAMPGEDVIFSPGGSIQKIEDNQFELIIWVGNGGSWRFSRLQLGNYQIRLEYSNDAAQVKVYGEDGKKKVINNIWTGKVLTSFIEFSLVDKFK
ncbi:MAG: hypothetical protein P2A85_15710 [Microcoleus anatoxicus]|uniref:hypothetical protein n=1 Tax=Microcoleus anatoxicus TaxID=2705319 RepID=UPI00366B97F5